ncbi:mandelate racemase/muconate lactonizing enzyme family protein [Devosia nitrariae]|nr:mandelate racemase/muconate lactonizing enzyme family protein [Devosia nitrariae]
MKITAVRTFLMQAGPSNSGKPPRQIIPVVDESQPRLPGSRNWLFVKVETDAGITGIGECSGWPRVIERAIEDLSSLLIGEDPTHIERIAQKLQVAMMGHGMLGTVGGGALTGIDIALWDIKGKALGTPVWNLLGGRVRDRVQIYTHANNKEFALSAKTRGFKAIKCSGGSGLQDPVRKVATMRELLGSDVDIAVDVHGPPWLTPIDAARLARALEPYDILWLEDPIAPDNLDGYKRIRDASTVPLAAGERVSGIFGERELIEKELVDIIQPDAGRAGGITQMKKIAAMAEAHHIAVAPHSGSLGPVAEYAALHLMASIPNALMLERMEDDWEGRRQTIVPHPEQADGFLTVPDAPGLGCDIVEAFIAGFPSQGNVSVPSKTLDDRDRIGGEGRLYVQTRLRRGKYFNAGDE